MYYNTDRQRRNWQRAKIAAQRMSARLYSLGQPSLFGDGEQRLDARARRMSQCGNRVFFSCCPECNISAIIRASFCRDRLCPLCNWRRGVRLAQEIRTACERIKTPLVFVTLTLPNVPWDRVGEGLDEAGRRWASTLRHLGRRVRGYLKVLEISRGRDGQAHIHIHAVLDAFGVTQTGLAALWGGHVDVRRVADPGAVGYYIAKGVQAGDLSDDDLAAFLRGVHGRRLYSSGGTLHLQHYETSSYLAGGVHSCCPHCGGVSVRVLYLWNRAGSCYRVECLKGGDGGENEFKSGAFCGGVPGGTPGDFSGGG